MSSKLHNWPSKSSGLYRNPSPSTNPDSFWFRDQASKNWSPKSNDSDPNFDSDEENIAMEIDCQIDSKDTVSQRPKFVLKTPLLSSVMSSDAQKKPCYYDSKYSLYGGSSKSLVVGRPMRAVGLKDVDLTKNARAEEIRRAKASNRCMDNRIIEKSMSQYSTHVLPYKKSRGKTAPSSYHGNIYGINDCGVMPNTPPPEYSTLALPCNTGKIPDDKGLPSVSDEIKKSKVITPKNQGSKLMLYSDFLVDDAKGNEGFERKEGKKKEVIEIDDDDDDDDDDDSKGVCLNDAFISSTHDDQNGCRQRHIKKRPCRMSSSCFSDDDDDDDDDEMVEATQHSKNKCETATSVDKPLQKSKLKRGTIFSALGLFAVLFLMLYSYLHINPHGLCLDSEFTVNLTGLEKDLKQEFYGQHLVMKVLLSSLKSHMRGKRNKPLVLSLHGWTGTGKNYVSGIIAKHLFKHGTQSKFVHKFIVPLHFPHVSNVDLYQKQLKQWITGNVTNCNKGGLFIFDEMDKIPDGIVKILKPFLDTRGLKSALDLSKFVFLFLSNSGGNLINQHVLQHYKQGYARETIDLVSLEGLLHKYAETNPSTWYSELLKSEVIDYFVPFLPLERSHVKQCVQRDMRTKGYIILEKMITEVTNEMSFFPQDLKLFSVAGCKKVSSKVDVAMG